MNEMQDFHRNEWMFTSDRLFSKNDQTHNAYKEVLFWTKFEVPKTQTQDIVKTFESRCKFFSTNDGCFLRRNVLKCVLDICFRWIVWGVFSRYGFLLIEFLSEVELSSMRIVCLVRKKSFLTWTLTTMIWLCTSWFCFDATMWEFCECTS